MDSARKIIDEAWESRASLNPAKAPAALRRAVEHVIAGLDSGKLRVAEKSAGGCVSHQWSKKAVLLPFGFAHNRVIDHRYYDKVPSKFKSFNFKKGGFRVVPPAAARRGAYIAKNVVLMPSFVNIGAYVDEGTMVDTWATVGSCAQIGKNCHLSGGVGIGGVLEPVQANPVIIEDNCFIGARSEVVEGVIVETGSVLSMGVFISATTRIVDRAPGEVFPGRVPPYSVLLAGVLQHLGSPAPRRVFSGEGTADIVNLYARLGTAGRNFCFAGHTDVVPPGNPASWTVAPFAGTVLDGTLWGRGAADMKGAI